MTAYRVRSYDADGKRETAHKAAVARLECGEPPARVIRQLRARYRAIHKKEFRYYENPHG